MGQKSSTQLASFDLSSDELLDEFLNALSVRTSLEELLGWDSDLADFLFGAWSTLPPATTENKDLTAALYAAQLPRKKYDIFGPSLEQWVLNNYNIFVR